MIFKRVDRGNEEGKILDRQTDRQTDRAFVA